MKFRISTLLILTAAIAMACALLSNRNRVDKNVVGHWAPMKSYWRYDSKLQIRADGTFTKIDEHEGGQRQMDGAITFLDDGKAVIHVKELTETDLKKKQKVSQVDYRLQYHYVFDGAGRLLIVTPPPARRTRFQFEATYLRGEP